MYYSVCVRERQTETQREKDSRERQSAMDRRTETDSPEMIYIIVCLGPNYLIDLFDRRNIKL